MGARRWLTVVLLGRLRLRVYRSRHTTQGFVVLFVHFHKFDQHYGPVRKLYLIVFFNHVFMFYHHSVPLDVGLVPVR